ncbi:MAG: peptidase M20 [Acidobacteria bacterium RIFCSPLOWO2_02_FULL_68_18]|nr:MAG: peptidase M20 [Acidobacteria bacterium RIFCSPLOWO2_02_FULL_68_18]OFW50314.1 MAG: peptidase M20 [Acidobacteria bacterium RIFCSPLOWO2_12_FULL_68_19]
MKHVPTRLAAACVAVVLGLSVAASGRQRHGPDWAAAEGEILRHFQTLVRFDTADPPGNETPAAAYLRQTLEHEGIPVQIFTLEPNRPNVVARLKGNGSKRPLLLMGHTDVVNVDPAKWTHPPFSAAREGGYIYGRGTLDDKDSVTTGLMIMLLLKRLDVPLDRDVIFLAEAGEEGNTRVGIQFMVDRHLREIEAEYCLAETGGMVRERGEVRYGTVQTLEKIPRAIDLTARGVSGHGSVPLVGNPVVHLAAAVARVGDWHSTIRLNETTRTYFARLAEISSGAEAQRYRDVLDPEKAAGVDRYFHANDPAKAALLHATASPTIIDGGYRLNVIPSEAVARLDLRILPDDDPAAVLDGVRKTVNDPSVEVAFAPRDVRPGGTSRLETEAFTALEDAVRRHYGAPTLPIMSTGATDMAYLRAKGVQCYGIGPAVDAEDAPKGFGSHSDQERILESELYRFVRFTWDVVVQLAARR